jgi:hypothetical protein
VKISSRRSVNAAAQRRIDLHADRAKTGTVRDAFPGVDVIHVNLGFSDRHPQPSPQMHSLYPAARAFFRFSCPCADCDGEFDLAAVINDLVTAGAPAKRTGRSLTGHSACQGVHWRDSDHSEACGIELSFRIVVSFVA